MPSMKLGASAPLLPGGRAPVKNWGSGPRQTGPKFPRTALGTLILSLPELSGAPHSLQEQLQSRWDGALCAWQRVVSPLSAPWPFWTAIWGHPLGHLLWVLTSAFLGSSLHPTKAPRLHLGYSSFFIADPSPGRQVGATLWQSWRRCRQIFTATTSPQLSSEKVRVCLFFIKIVFFFY